MSSKFRWVFIFFSLILLSGVAFGFFMLYTENLKLKNDLTIVNSSLNTKLNKLQDNQVTASQDLIKLDNKVATLTNVNQTTLIIYQIDQLITSANQSLLIYKDLPTALKLLQYAKAVLQGNNNPIFTNLKLNLSQDIDHLTALPIVDETYLNGELNELLNHINDLSTVSETKVESGIASQAKPMPWYKKLWSNLSHDLSTIIKISSSRVNAKVLLPQDEVILKQSLKLNFLYARLALLEHDQTLWESSLKLINDSLNSYFVADPISNNMKTNVNKLLQNQIAIKSMNIDATLTSLNKLNNNLSH